MRAFSEVLNFVVCATSTTSATDILHAVKLRDSCCSWSPSVACIGTRKWGVNATWRSTLLNRFASPSRLWQCAQRHVASRCGHRVREGTPRRDVLHS